MKKSAFLALVVCGVMPLSSCNNNGDQSGYMQSSSAESNAKEAELAEQEFADLASKESAGEDTSAKRHTARKTASVAAKVTAKNAKSPRKPASKEIAKAVHVEGRGAAVYTVQLGAFKVKENAAKLAAKLKQDGFPAIMRPSVKSSGEFYLVHLEPTPNKTEAEKWQIDLKEKSFDSTLTSHRE